MRIAFFGQAAFGRDVLLRLLSASHDVVGVYVPPEGGRPDPLASEAEQRDLPLFRHRRFRRRGSSGLAGASGPGGPRSGRPSGPDWEAIPEILDEFRGLGADLNVLAFVTAILPPEIVAGTPRGSLCFHPSLLPRFRGGAALAWQIILGETESGVTIFEPDAGVDTGPIVVQRGGVTIGERETAGSLYFDHLYALGVEAMAEAVADLEAGTARREPQDESRATAQGLIGDAEARIDWSRPAAEVDRQVRGCDPQPGAFGLWKSEKVRLFDGSLVDREDASTPGTIVGVRDGRLLIAAVGGCIAVGRVRVGGGKKVPAAGADVGIGVGERLD